MGFKPSELTHILIDLDDTVYPTEKGIWGQISVRMDSYLTDVMGVPFEETHALRRRLFQTYGTTLRGLQIEKNVDMQQYLDYVHDISLDGVLAPDPELRRVLTQIPQQKWIFTNASLEHAEKVLDRLQLRDLFMGIIDITAIYPWCKPYPEAFQTALVLCGNPEPERCLFIDDSIRNLDTAAELRLKTVLISDQPSLFHPTISHLELLEDLLHANYV